MPVKVNLCRDPVLPQREAVVRPAEVAERLSSLLGVGEPLPVRGCRVARVNYQPGTSLRVVYELELPGQPLIVAVRAAAVHGLRSEGLRHLDALLADATTLVN